MVLLRYALRNLTRRKGRTVLTTAAVALAVGLVMIGACWLAGIQQNVLNEFTRRTGHVRVRHVSYEAEQRFSPLEYTLEDWRGLKTRLEALPSVVSAQPRLHFQLLVQHTDMSTVVPEDSGVDESELTDEQIMGRKLLEFAPGLGVDVQLEAKANRVDDRMTAGSRWIAGPDSNEVVIGVELARRLGVQPGDDLELLSYRKGIRDAPAKVVGIFDMGNRFANRFCYMPIAMAEELLELEGRATELLVFGEKVEDSDRILAEIQRAGLGEGREVRPWSTIGIFQFAVQIIGAVANIMLMAVIIIAVVGLLNTMLMSVLERQREIGVLLALGLTKAQVIALLMFEAVGFAVVGTLLGVVWGSVGCWHLTEHGILLGAEAGRNMVVPIAERIHGSFTYDVVLIAAATGLVVAILAAVWPAIKAANTSPVEAMRRA